MRKRYDVDVQQLLAEAEKAGCVEAFGEELFSLYKLYKSNYDVRQILTNPNYSLDFKMECITEVFTDPATPKFFFDFTALILEDNLLSKLYSIYHRYLELVARKYNLTIIQAITAVPLNKKKTAEITAKLEKMFKQKIIMKNIVDSRIIGGIILKVPPDRIIDVSIRKKMIDLNQFVRNF